MEQVTADSGVQNSINHGLSTIQHILYEYMWHAKEFSAGAVNWVGATGMVFTFQLPSCILAMLGRRLAPWIGTV